MPRCVAHSSRTGEPCKKNALKGMTVCRTHGGATAHVQEGARKRLEKLVDPAIDALASLLSTASDAVKMAAVKDVLDRAGYKPKDKVELTGEDGGPVSTSIQVVFIDPPARRVPDQAPLSIPAETL